MFSPDGNAIAANCGRDGIHIWSIGGTEASYKRRALQNITNRGDLRTVQFQTPSTLVFFSSRKEASPDSLPDPELVFWDIPSDREIRSIPLPYMPDAIAMAPEANIAVVTANASEIRQEADCQIIDLTTGLARGHLRIGDVSEPVMSELALSRNGAYLAVAIYKSGWGMEVWDLKTQTRVLERKSCIVESISGDGRVVAISDTNQMVATASARHRILRSLRSITNNSLYCWGW